MAQRAEAFFKGGLGCVGAFIVVGALVLVIGGHVHADLGGLCCLFVGGGLLGLVVLAIYNKGRRDADPYDDQTNGTNEP